MIEVYIHDLAYSLGEEAQEVEAAGDQGLLISPPALLRDAGFGRHHRCGASATAYDLARAALEPIKPALADVGAIIYSVCIPLNANLGSEAEYDRTRDVKHLMDFPASRLQADFDLSDAMVIGLNQQACTGMLGSLMLARGLLNTEPNIQSVLCVTADRFPEGALYEQSYNLISDGAAACVVSRRPRGFRFLAHHHVTNGAMSRASDDETVGSFFNHAHLTIKEATTKAGLDIRSIDWIVPQNTNRKAWLIMANLLGVDADRVYFETIGEVGHVISGDNIINLSRLDGESGIQSGQRVLLFMAGYGLNWQCVLLEKV